MAKKNPDFQLIAETIQECKETKALPPMTPDLFDDFVTWLYERVDLRSFTQSGDDYKMKKYREFIRQLPPMRLQLCLFDKTPKLK